MTPPRSGIPHPRTLRAVFDAERVPAVRVTDLDARLRRLGSVSTPDSLCREVATGLDELRTVDPAGAVLREVVETCPLQSRPVGADAVVVDGTRRGLRPTPADAVRVLARRLEPGGRADRARWVRLLHGIPEFPHPSAWDRIGDTAAAAGRGQDPADLRNRPDRHSPSASTSTRRNPSPASDATKPSH